LYVFLGTPTHIYVFTRSKNKYPHINSGILYSDL